MRPRVVLLLAVILAGCATEPAAPGAPSVADPTEPTPAQDGSTTPLVHVADPERATTAGRNVTFLVQARGLEGSAATVRLEGRDAEGEATIAAGEEGAFVTLRVAPDTEAGEVALTLYLAREGAAPVEIPEAAALRILPAQPGFAEPAVARVRFTLRYAESQDAVASNDPALVDAAFPRGHLYAFTPGELNATRRDVVRGFFEALLGMQVGESRTVTLSPSEAYGDAVVVEVAPRVEVQPRTVTFPNPVLTMTRASFDFHVSSTGQGDPAAFEGRTFVRSDARGNWTYAVLELGNDTVRYQLTARSGERHTVYPAWPGASEVVSANGTEIVYFTTPTTPPGSRSTWRTGWFDMTEVVEVTDREIVLRHSPPVGYSWAVARDHRTIGFVDEENVTIFASPSYPLAGHALTLDVTLVDVLA